MNTDHYTLITGGSQGFGRALALECAGRSMNLVLVSLPDPELEALAVFIRVYYRVKVLTIELDLNDEANYQRLYTIVKGHGIRINFLINNAGVLSKDLFENLPLSYLHTQIRVNVMAPTLLIKLFLNDLVSNGPSRILNVGSLSCFFFLPRKQVYGATKSFIYNYSKSLNTELTNSRVSVSVVCPGGMNTSVAMTYRNMSQPWYSRISIMDPEQVAAITIRQVLRNKKVIIPGFFNRFYLALSRLLPERVKRQITSNAIHQIKTEAGKEESLTISA